MESEPDCVTWWLRPPLCSSVLLTQKDKEMPIWGGKGFENMLHLANTQEVMLHALSRKDFEGGYRKRYQKCEL